MTQPEPRPAGRLRVAYLSGSPRISTRDDAAVFGPRAHILGMIGALRADGHVVEEYIVGDRLGARGEGGGARRLRPVGSFRQLLIDVVRLTMRPVVARQARRRTPGRVDVAYERYALFQQLGRPFQRAGSVWVVETNAVLSREARSERRALVLVRLAAVLERRTYRRADVVVCVSEPLRQMLVDEVGVPPGKVVVVPNAVDLTRFRATSVPAGRAATPGEMVIGYLGYVIERQGLDELVEAVAALRSRGRRLRAVIIGDGPDRARLEALVDARELGAAVHFHDQVPWTEVPSWINSFSVGYSGQRGVAGMPMYHSPLKIYEYLAMARPVIAARHPDAASVVEASGAGWTFTPGSTGELVDVLDRVLSLSESELSSAGARGRAHIEAHHVWTHRSRALVDELRRRDLVGAG